MSNGIGSFFNIDTPKSKTADSPTTSLTKSNSKDKNSEIAGSTAMLQASAGMVACILSQPNAGASIGVNLGSPPSFGTPAKSVQETNSDEKSTVEAGGPKITIGESPKQEENPKIEHKS